jgi:hypothetical protein
VFSGTRPTWRMTSSVALAIGALACPASVLAELTFVPRVTLAETWTDNVTLAPDGQEASEWITELRPGFSLLKEGPRIKALLDYDLQALWFADNSDFNDTYHQLLGNANFALVPETLFLDAFGRYDQRNINPEGRVAYSNIFQTGNRTDAIVFGASPYHVGRWGSWGESLVRYRYQATRFRDTDATTLNVEDSDTNAVSAALGSPAAMRGLSWRTSGSYTQTEFDLGSEFKYANVALDLGYPVGPRTRATATIGQESDIQADPTGGGLDVTYWYVGFAWNPNDLQSLEVRVGERYFGTAYSLDYRRRAARSEIGVSYTEEPTTASGVLGGDDMFIPGTRPGGSPALDTRVFLRKRLSANATYELARSRIGASSYAEARDYEDQLGGTERVYGARVNYDWDFAQRTTLGTSINWERRDLANTNRQDDYGDFDVRVMRELTRTLSGMFRVSHFLRNADGANDYNANQVALSVEAKF